ncbi:MAG: ASKHA domain-containing protein [Thermodesulfobacteriota bacterium]
MTATGHENGWIRQIPLELVPPSIQDNTADADRLLAAIRKALKTERVSAGIALIRRIPAVLRDCRYRVRALVWEKEPGAWHLMDLYAPEERGAFFGAAVDLGTTTLVVRLVDLLSGETMREVSFANPQIPMGPDILTRIHHAAQPEGLAALRNAVLDGVNRELGRLAESEGVEAAQIAGVSLAGNTTMSHLFLGLDPYWICREPYIPVINAPDPFTAADLGLKIHPEAPVLVLPSVGSYFGGDLIAGILASGIYREESLSILVDVGTNAEVVLGNRDWLVGCAGAAGPALEGGVANIGMTASPGVIDRVSMDPASGDLRIRTIDNRPPVGICGSGLIDLVAHLFLSGRIDARGKFVAERCGDRLTGAEGMRQFVVVPKGGSGTGDDLTLGQSDLDALVRSKAAMYTILTTVTRMVNVSMKEIRNFYTAGTFGLHIDPRSAIVLGMLPDLPIETYKPLGNTSLAGATQVLLSSSARKQIREIRNRVTYVELNVNQEFMNLFNGARFIPHTDRTLFPSVTNDK